MILRRLLRGAQEFVEKGAIIVTSRSNVVYDASDARIIAAARNPWPEAQKTLFRFSTPDELAQWTTFSDCQLGGRSTARLLPSAEFPSTAEFRGVYSREVDDDASERLKRSGFAGISSRPEPGDYIDLDDYHSLVFRVRGDGRKYLANIRTDNWVVGETGQDVWQAFLFARAGEWADVEIPLDRFLLTWRGKFVEQRVEMNPARVTGVGISLVGGEELQAEGEYRLGLEWIAARNNAVVIEREE